MPRTHLFSIALVLSMLALGGCNPFREQEKPEVDLTEIFPTDLPAIGQAQRLNVDGKGIDEWLVFYHVDLVQGDVEGSPTAAAVYRPVEDQDGRRPPRLIPALLWLPRRGYLCLYTCEAEMRDVIGSGSEGQELVVQDKRGDDVVGVAIFRWDKDLQVETERAEQMPPGGFVPLGHFRADAIEIEKDKVTVIRKYNDRSNLAAQEIYNPAAGRYYHQQVRHVDDAPGLLRSPQEAEIVFLPGPPTNPAQVKQPEKLVLAFYQNFRDAAQVEGYFTESAWDKIGEVCPENACGCSSERKDVARVMVKQIAYESDLDQKSTQVIVQVVCVNKNDQAEAITTVMWSLRRRVDQSWRLTDVVPGGEDQLCPRWGCQP